MRNRILLLLFLTSTLNVFDRQIINVLGESIKHDLQISDAALGLLTGTAFGLFYSVLGIPIGRLADRVNRIRLIAALLALWSVFTGLCGLASNFVQLFITRMGVGVGEAGAQPASTAIVADLFPNERRTSALSVLLLGAPVGSFLGLLVGGYIGSIWGWRAVFLFAAIPGLILAAVIAVTLRDAGASPVRHAGAHDRSFAQALGAFAANRTFVWLALSMVCASFFAYASGAWFPPFLIRVHGLTTAQVGFYAALAVGGGGLIGTLGSGILCDVLRARTRFAESTVLMCALTLALCLLLVTVLSHSRGVALGAMFFFNICAFAYSGPTVTLIQQEAAPETRALAVAICVAVSNIINLGAALPLVGLASDALQAEHGAAAIGYALAFAAVIAAVIGLFAHWRIRAHTRQVPA